MFQCVYLKNTTVMGPVYLRGFSFTLNESIYPLFSFFKLLIFISQNSSYLSPAALGIHSIFAMISITIEVFLFSSLVSLFLSYLHRNSSTKYLNPSVLPFNGPRNPRPILLLPPFLILSDPFCQLNPFICPLPLSAPHSSV